MPGAKRRALKKLLSPITSPHGHQSPPPTLASPSNEPNLTLNPSHSSFSSLTADPANYLTDTQLKEDLEAEAVLDGNSNGDTNGIAQVQNGNGGAIGEEKKGFGAPEMPYNGGDGGGGAGLEQKGKKKSSKQRFAEREVRHFRNHRVLDYDTDPKYRLGNEKLYLILLRPLTLLGQLSLRRREWKRLGLLAMLVLR